MDIKLQRYHDPWTEEIVGANQYATDFAFRDSSQVVTVSIAAGSSARSSTLPESTGAG